MQYRRLGRDGPQISPIGIGAMSFSDFYGPTTEAESHAVADRIRASDAALVFIGLGCPRQEVFAFENSEALGCPVIAVGAAFDFHAGTLKQAPRWMQDSGLEWLFRFVHEPRRLWHRYMVLNPLFCLKIARQWLSPASFASDKDAAPVGRQNYV